MIELDNVTIGRGRFLLSGVTQVAPAGALTVLTGKVGSGKTTLVEAICGLKAVARGHVCLRGENVEHLPPAHRRVGYLPQDVALFEHLSVRQNIAFGCECQRFKRGAIEERVSALANDLEISDLLDRFPQQLSGGQQKAVGIARAAAAQPDILCLDEPFVALDDSARTLLTGWLERLLQSGRTTVLVVTHRPELLKGIAQHQWQL